MREGRLTDNLASKDKRQSLEQIDPNEIMKMCLSCKKNRCTNCVSNMTTEEKRNYVHKS